MGSCLSSERQNKNSGKALTIGSFSIIIEDKISEGGYGDIWKCKDTQTKQIYAAKQIRLQTPELRAMYEKQVSWLKALKETEGIVQIMGSIELPSKSNKYSTGIILTQFCEKTLFDEIKNRIFSAEEIINITKQLLKVLRQIHAKKCIHLDIKPENILIDQKGSSIVYKICDFGSCRQGPINVKQMSKYQKSKLKDYIEANSTLMYRAPELIDIQGNTKVIDSKADIWMLGCILFLMVYRKHPFQDQGSLAIMTGYDDYSLKTQSEQLKQETLENIIELLKLMLTVNPQKRPDQQFLLIKIQKMFGDLQ